MVLFNSGFKNGYSWNAIVCHGSALCVVLVVDPIPNKFFSGPVLTLLLRRSAKFIKFLRYVGNRLFLKLLLLYGH